MKYIKSGKLISANETVDERWGREFKPLPFASILTGHISACHINLPRPLVALLRNNHKNPRQYDHEKDIVIAEWGYLPFDKLVKNMSLECIRSLYKPSREEINDYLTRLPKFRTRFVEHSMESNIRIELKSRNDAINSIDESAEYAKLSLSHDSKTQMLEIGRSLALSSSFASSDGGSLSKSYLSNPFRSYFGSNNSFESDLYLSRGLTKFNYCSESDNDDPFILNGLLGKISPAAITEFDNQCFSLLSSKGSFSISSSSGQETGKTKDDDTIRRHDDAVNALEVTSDIALNDTGALRHQSPTPMGKNSKTLSFGKASYFATNYEPESILRQHRGDSEKEEPKPRVQIREYRRKSQSNPFRKQEGINYLNARTHNRRRWSYVFPAGKLGQSMTAFYGKELNTFGNNYDNDKMNYRIELEEFNTTCSFANNYRLHSNGERIA
jgi:hypothetical protein